MIESVIHPISAVFLGLEVDEVILEISLVCLSSFWSAMSPQSLPFKAQMLFGRGMGYRIHFPPFGRGFTMLSMLLHLPWQVVQYSQTDQALPYR